MEANQRFSDFENEKVFSVKFVFNQFDVLDGDIGISCSPFSKFKFEVDRF